MKLLLFKKTFLFFFLISCLSTSLFSKLVRYDFTIEKKIIVIDDKKSIGMTINGQIPAPTIRATVGDTLRVTFRNKTDEDTSIHWHGVLLPNDQDGVPYLTTPPIKAHNSFTYEYEITVPGTYWYHSHTKFHEQQGMYGALIFSPKDGEKIKTDRDYTVVLSDWTREHPEKILSHLKQDGDYYALKKDNVQSWDQVIAHGREAIKHRIKSSWNRMEPMDISDIGYDFFLTNGKPQDFLIAKPGEHIRLRIINAAAGTYFNLQFSGGRMTVVSADGVDIEPYNVEKLKIAIAETYDVVVTIPETTMYELRATSEDGTRYSSTYLFSPGTKDKKIEKAPTLTGPNLFIPHDHGKKKHEYSSLRALYDTTLPQKNKRKEITLRLTGNMMRYAWSFDNKTLTESDVILIQKNENVRIRMINETMMHHPIHLHGHFFRVLNGQGKRSPLKHTVNVPAMDEITIEFEANTDGDWFFHCHNLYHMMSGMARVFGYKDSTKASKKTLKKLTPDTWYTQRDVSVLSNMLIASLSASNTRNSFEIEFDHDYDHEYEIDFLYVRNILPKVTRFLDVYCGANFEREHDDTKSRKTILIGLRYVLPLLIHADVRFDSKLKFCLEVGSELQLMKRLLFEWCIDTDNEYRFSLSYEISKQALIQGVYDSDYGWGAGIRARI